MEDPTGPRYESVVDRQIRLAQERGAFDDLPGAGRPLPGLDGPDDELWWVKGLLRREGLSTELLLPPSIQLRKEVDRLPDTLRTLRTEREVRDAVRLLNVRIAEHLRAPSGPRVRVGPVNVEEAVRAWTAAREPERPPVREEPAAGPPAAVVPARRDRWWHRPWSRR